MTVAASSSALPADNFEQHSWGQLVRGAPVHSDPSVSSDIIGYAAAGTEAQLLQRNDGWVRILDPATSREGWIYEEHITAKAGPSALEHADGRQVAALENDLDPGEVEQPRRFFKAKKSRKKLRKETMAQALALRFQVQAILARRRRGQT
jgi:Bacterial SH3 domain